MKRRTRERKGKSVAKEELMEEVFLIQDDSEEEQEMYDSDRAVADQYRETGGKGIKQQLEEHQEQDEIEERQGHGQRRTRAEGSTSRLENRGRGRQYRNKGGRGRGRGQRGRGRGRAGRPDRKTRRSLDKKV